MAKSPLLAILADVKPPKGAKPSPGAEMADGEDEAPESGEGESMGYDAEAAAERMLKAIEAKDAAGLAKAFKQLASCCEEE